VLQQSAADQKQLLRKMSGSTQSQHSQGLVPFGSTMPPGSTAGPSSTAAGTPAHRQPEQAEDFEKSPFARQGSTTVFSAHGSTPASSARPSCGGFGSAVFEAENVAGGGRASKASSAGQQQVQAPLQPQQLSPESFAEVRQAYSKSRCRCSLSCVLSFRDMCIKPVHHNLRFEEGRHLPTCNLKCSHLYGKLAACFIENVTSTRTMLPLCAVHIGAPGPHHSSHLHVS
jgi:hypothetical protein